MLDALNPLVGTLGYTAPTQKREASGNFLDAMSHISDLQKVQAEETELAQPASLEERLKAKYPNLAYHVFDASTSYWRTRNDYPHYLLYQQDIDTQALENWTPSGPNPFYGSVDGQFIAPKEIHALGSLPPGSKAVVIHPKVQQRMEEDPAYADEIMARIEGWWAFDVARNEAIRPGSTAMMSQSVAIGEDGSIVNVQASSPGGYLTTSGDDDEEVVDFWELRIKRHTEFMKLRQEDQIEHSMAVSEQFAALNARAYLVQMLNDGHLRQVLGDTIAGMSTEKVFVLTRQDVWGIEAE